MSKPLRPLDLAVMLAAQHYFDHGSLDDLTEEKSEMYGIWSGLKDVRRNGYLRRAERLMKIWNSKP